MALHPLLEAAGREGRLPPWAAAEERRDHVERVTELVDGWAARLGIPEPDRVRWRAAARLHDALKGVAPHELRRWASGDWPEPVLHGPACAGRLREAGVEDEEVLLAIAFHSIGHPSLTALGEYLYLADFLEPGRRNRPAELARLRERLPAEKSAVLVEVAARRIVLLLDKRLPVMQPTIDFWNRLMAARVD